MSKNLSKSPTECFEILITMLTDMQSLLPKKYRSDTISRDKLLNAVHNVESFCPRYHKPADTVQGIVSDLHALLASTKAIFTSASSSIADVDEPSFQYVDRSFVGAQSSQNSPKRPSHRRVYPRESRYIVCHEKVIDPSTTQQKIV